MSDSPMTALARLYQTWFTGALLFTATRKSAQAAGDLSFALFRRQHHEKFLSSFEKLGLKDKPDAVACAQYHFLSNGVGGVGVEYMYESDQKAWVRFLHPRWMYEGAALAGMPQEVSLGFLKGWYAHNGVSLENPKLGFVCTSQDMNGQYGLAGYFQEYDEPLQPEQRLRFAPNEVPPLYNPGLAPMLDGKDWPEERLQKAQRNYAMTYMRSLLPEMVALFGPLEATYLGAGSAEIIARQCYRDVAASMDIEPGGAANFARLMQRLGEASGDAVEIVEQDEQVLVRQTGWRLMADQALHPAVFDCWNGLWRGLLAMHDRFCVIEVLQRMDYGDPVYEWRVRPVAAQQPAAE
ncbi:MAG: hypothetical protein AB8B93_12270 [Pseudomonadales bacterium]